MASESIAKHRIPVIDRMMEVLALLEKRNNGASIRELVDLLGLPRTTVYRILNTLQFHDVVKRTAEGSYRLGPRLLSLAARTLPDAQDYDLAALSRPHLEALAEKTGEGCKVSVLDGNAVLVVAAVQGTREYALTVVPGQHQPLHAGAASKMLLAHLPRDELDALLGEGELVRYTSKTVTDRKRLYAELARIRRDGWSEDRGEYSPSILAYAAPIRDRNGKVVAALSVPFLLGSSPEHREVIRVAAIAVAGAIAADLPPPTQAGQIGRAAGSGAVGRPSVSPAPRTARSRDSARRRRG
jgi:DNA-binding IclR family transcriptional regulator